MEPGHAPIFVVLNAAPEEIAFKLPRMADYKNWQQVLNTAEDKQTTASLVSAADTKAPPRSVLVFAGSA
jgi:glycogen operon protein